MWSLLLARQQRWDHGGYSVMKRQTNPLIKPRKKKSELLTENYLFAIQQIKQTFAKMYVYCVKWYTENNDQRTLKENNIFSSITSARNDVELFSMQSELWFYNKRF